MANVTAATTVWNCPNYLGELFLIGAQSRSTPFLTMIGGVNGAMSTQSFDFPLAQPWSLEAAAQPAITETASQTAPTPTTYVRGQDSNTTQIFQQKVSVSYAKQSNSSKISGLSLAGEPQPVMDEVDFQIQANLLQIAKDANYSFLNGVYQTATDAATASKTRGIITGTTTTEVAGGGVAITRALMDELFVDMANNGATFTTPVIFATAADVQRISALYAQAPADRFIGGVNVATIISPLVGEVAIVWDANIPSGTILLADVSVCGVMATPVPEKGVLFYEELAKVGAAEPGQLYGQMGIAYGAEEYHGKITGLLA